MLTRCENPNHPQFKRYGKRGIEVCKRWHVYENFLIDMGRRPENPTPGRRHFSIDRIDNDGDYKPGNCRWADYFQQNNNHSRNRAE